MNHYTQDFRQRFNNKNMMSSWYELEGGDSDVLLDELRKQVLQLTADDDGDEEFPANKERRSKQGGFTNRVQVGCEFEWTGSMDDTGCRVVPQWLLELWRSTENKDAMFNGTGVFIPHIVNTRRRYKPRKKNNDGRGRVYKPVAKVN